MADTTIKLSGTYDSIEAYELLEEMRGVASDYLPLTGGEISGDLIVDGQLSATLTGNVTGTASGNLPLSGGTMTGDITGGHLFSVQNSADNDSTRMFGASAWNKGAGLNLWGKDHVDYPGVFSLYAHDGTNTKQLTGRPDGTLTWNGKNVIVSQTNIMAGTTSATTVAANNTATVNVSFGITFASVPKVVASCSISYAGVYAGVVSVTTTGCVIRFNNTSTSSRSLTADWIAIAI